MKKISRAAVFTALFLVVGAQSAIATSPSAALSGARKLFESGNYSQAAEGFRRVMREYPSSMEASVAGYYAGYAEERMGNRQRAIEVYREVLGRYGSADIARSIRLRLTEVEADILRNPSGLRSTRLPISQSDNKSARKTVEKRIGKDVVKDIAERTKPPKTYSTSASFPVLKEESKPVVSSFTSAGRSGFPTGHMPTPSQSASQQTTPVIRFPAVSSRPVFQELEMADPSNMTNMTTSAPAPTAPEMQAMTAGQLPLIQVSSSPLPKSGAKTALAVPKAMPQAEAFPAMPAPSERLTMMTPPVSAVAVPIRSDGLVRALEERLSILEVEMQTARDKLVEKEKLILEREKEMAEKAEREKKELEELEARKAEAIKLPPAKAKNVPSPTEVLSLSENGWSSVSEPEVHPVPRRAVADLGSVMMRRLPMPQSVFSSVPRKSWYLIPPATDLPNEQEVRVLDPVTAPQTDNGDQVVKVPVPKAKTAPAPAEALGISKMEEASLLRRTAEEESKSDVIEELISYQVPLSAPHVLKRPTNVEPVSDEKKTRVIEKLWGKGKGEQESSEISAREEDATVMGDQTLDGDAQFTKESTDYQPIFSEEPAENTVPQGVMDLSLDAGYGQPVMSSVKTPLSSIARPLLPKGPVSVSPPSSPPSLALDEELPHVGTELGGSWDLRPEEFSFVPVDPLVENAMVAPVRVDPAREGEMSSSGTGTSAAGTRMPFPTGLQGAPAPSADEGGAFTAPVVVSQSTISPESVESMKHLRQAMRYRKMGIDEKAVEEYEKSIEADPTNAVAMNNLADLYISRGEKLDLAISLISNAMSQNITDRGPYLSTLASAYFAKGDFERAEDFISEALAIRNTSERLYQRSRVYMAMGLVAKARADLDRARVYSQDAAMTTKIREALQELGTALPR